MQKTASIIPIGNYDWYVLRQIGNKYFVLSESPLFRGYYSLESCPFSDSKLSGFLNNKFRTQLERNGVDTSKLSNIGILTAGQYQMYVKNKLPASASPYLLQTVHPTVKDCVIGVDAQGEYFPSKITDSCGIRPCMFIEKDYAEEISGIAAASITFLDISDPVNPSEHTGPTQIQTPVISVITDITKPIGQEPDTNADQPEQAEAPVPSADQKENEVDTESVKESESLAEESVLTQISENDSSVSCEEQIVETEVEQIQTVEQTVQITSVGDQKAAYLFNGSEYDRFAVLYDGDEDELKKMLREYGLTVSAFRQSSLVPDRKKPTAADVQAFMEQQKNRFRWSGTKRR